MGGEMSVRRSVNIIEALELPESSSASKFQLFRCKVKHLGEDVSMFMVEKESHHSYEKEENNVDVLKTLRHPCILKYHNSSNSKTELALITDNVVPLASVVADMCDTELLSGLFAILEALVFLENKAGLSHCSLSLASVFVSTKDRSWKLGGFEEASKASAKGRGNDAKDFAEFSLAILDHLQFQGDPNVRLYTELLERDFVTSTDKMHGNLSKLLQHPVFRNEFLEIFDFLSGLTGKSEQKKKLFFNSLAKKLQSVPHLLIAKRLIPMLLSRHVLEHATPGFLTALFQYEYDSSLGQRSNAAVLPADLFREVCVPAILTMLESRDTDVRLIVLQYFGCYGTAIDSATLEESVLPEVLLGLSDTDDRIVAETFRALSVMTGILGGEKVVGSVRMKHFLDCKPVLPRTKDTHHRDISDIASRPAVVNTVPCALVSADTSETSSFAAARALREQRRLEREQQRLERKSRRERLQRQQLQSYKPKGIGLRVGVGDSDDGPTTVEEEEASVITNGDVSRVTGSHSKRVSESKEESDAEWEGFEAQSSEAEEIFAHSRTSSPPEVGSARKGSWDADWGDPTSKAGTGMKLSHQRSYPSTLVESSPRDDLTASSSRSTPVVPAHTPSPRSGSRSSAVAKATNKGLGEEFQVCAVSIPSRADEMDFFADMRPDVATKPVHVIKQRGNSVSDKFRASDVQHEAETADAWEQDGWDDM